VRMDVKFARTGGDGTKIPSPCTPLIYIIQPWEVQGQTWFLNDFQPRLHHAINWYIHVFNSADIYRKNLNVQFLPKIEVW